MTPSVLFTELFQPNFSSQLLIPISLVTDATKLEYIPSHAATKHQLESLFALASHISQYEQPKVHRMIALGEHSTLFAKILLNTTIDYTVDTVTNIPTTQVHANQYINSPNLFNCYYLTSQFLTFSEYDCATFTTIADLASYPPEVIPTNLSIATVINETDTILTRFDAHEYASQFLKVDQVDTLVTSDGKVFTVSGVKL